jgi:hypothetical protein
VSSRVGRVHVRCAAPPEESERALRLRGRLVRTARTHLPDALAQSLEEGRSERRIFAERVQVALDFDPDEYDDVTTAVLWAGRVRAALQLEGAGEGTGVEIFESDAAFYGRAAVEYARTGELPWFFAELPCGAGRPRARVFLEAFDTPEKVVALARALSPRPDAAVCLYARLTDDERRAAVAALEGARFSEGRAHEESRRSETRAGRPNAGGERRDSPSDTAGADSAAAGRRQRSKAPPPPTAPGRAAPQETAGPPPVSLGRWRAALELRAREGVAELADTPTKPANASPPTRVVPALEPAVEAAPTPIAEAAGEARELERVELEADEAETELAETQPAGDETAWWTRVGGLVLLYPWLADLLQADVPTDAGLAHRSWALAAIMAPGEEPRLLGDPLVRILAGDDPARPVQRLPAPEEPERLVAAGEEVLRSFAACLPGFEESSADYLRRFVLERGGLVAVLPEDAYGIRLEPLPLDPILARLPYPLGPFRLPWTRPTHVELRGA